MQKKLFKKPTRMDGIREQRDRREQHFGPRLDKLDAIDLLQLCGRNFPDWPVVFSRRFTVEGAREDVVLRRLLLFALEQSGSRTQEAKDL